MAQSLEGAPSADPIPERTINIPREGKISFFGISGDKLEEAIMRVRLARSGDSAPRQN